MLLLSGPYGWNAHDGAVISLRTAHTVRDEAALVSVLKQFSCYPLAIPKIISCLRNSGRYDCILQLTWFSYQKAEVIEAMRQIGVLLIHRGNLNEMRRQGRW